MIVSASRIYSQFTQRARTLLWFPQSVRHGGAGCLATLPLARSERRRHRTLAVSKVEEAAGVCLGAQEAPGASSSAVGRGAVHPVKRALEHAASVVLHCCLAGWDWLNIGRRSAASKSDKIVGVFRPCALHVT